MATPPPGQQQAQGSRPDPHLVALKVLRSTRPSLVPSKTPIYDPLAFGGAALRSLEQASATEGRGSEYGLTGALMLPSSFGSIYLGETFNAVLSLSNDLAPSSHPSTIAHSPVLKVEMHTGLNPQSGAAAVKHPLANVTAQTPSAALAPGQSQEAAVSWELKELGVHALVCTVTYAVQAVVEDGTTRTVSRSFRKVYKFQVNNPLSVRTKAHAPTPSTPTSFLSPTERRKVFLEVQVQNQCEHAMWFERMLFDPLPGWALDDEVNEGLFEGEEALLPQGAVRQFVFVLSAGEAVPPAAPASSQGLGRLDIVWRTPNGEIGRLQTSMLGRRVPQPPAPLNLPSSSAVPPEPAPVPSPLPESAPGSKPPPAPYRSTSYIARGGTAVSSAVPAVPLPSRPLPPLFPSASNLDFDLTVSSLSSSSPSAPLVFTRDVPFTLAFHLAVSDLSPPASLSSGKRRRLRIAAQHIQFHPSPLSPPPAPSSLSANPRAHQAPQAAAPTLTLPGALSGSPAIPQTITSLQQQQQLVQRSPAPLSTGSSLSTPRALSDSATFAAVDPSTRSFPTLLPFPHLSSSSSTTTIRLPAPLPLPSSPLLPPAVLPSREIVRLGPAVVELGFLTLEQARAGAGAGGGEGNGGGRRGEVEFKMRFVPLGTGLLRVGGVRILLLEESVVEGEGEEEEGAKEEEEEEEGERKNDEGTTRERHAAVVREWETVAEVWVGSSSGSGAAERAVV